MKKLLEKQKELIELLDRYFVSKTRPSMDELIESEELKYQIKELDQESEYNKLRDDLIKYTDWFSTRFNTHLNEDIVDEYMKL